MRNVIFVISIFYILFTGTSWAQKFVAVGEGFEITEQDVSELIKFFEENGFTSTDAQYKEAALKLRLFVEEAISLGITPESYSENTFLGKSKEYSGMTMKEKYILQDLYIKNRVENHPVSALAIESYYWAHPDYFAKPDEENEGLFVFMPLDDDLKEKIRLKIAYAQKVAIALKLYEELKYKYKVQFCDAEGVCK